LHRLADNDLAIEKREAVLTNVVTAGKVECGNIGFRKGRGRKQLVKEKFRMSGSCWQVEVQLREEVTGWASETALMSNRVWASWQRQSKQRDGH
jgi:hypothetical protein